MSVITKTALGVLCVLLLAASLGDAAPGGAFKAGLARVVITPDKPVWMAGYASRNKPAEGKMHDLYAKALALEDARGARIVIVTTDLLGLPRAMTTPLREHANKRYGLKPEQILFNSSHTHTGPVLAGSLGGAYFLDATQLAAVNVYTKQLEEKLLGVMGAALKDLSPAKISYAQTTAPFAMNRRQMTEKGMVIGVNREGVVDRDVPVLRIEAPDGKLRGVVFGYACHNTTLTGEFYQMSGDYAGYAQEALERAHPGATAMFVMGCGADINPYPRSKLEYAQSHGETLARSVGAALGGAMESLGGEIKTALGVTPIPFAPLPTRQEWEARLADTNKYKSAHAARMLDQFKRDGKLPNEYPYTVQVVRLGDVTLIALAGEVVTDYSLRLKRELAGKVWVAGYSNDLCSYIPSARMIPEGGYEVIDSQIYYDKPGPYAPELEERIISEAHKLARKVGVPRAVQGQSGHR